MTEDPNPVEEPKVPEDPPPSSDPVPEPGLPKPLQADRDARRKTRANNLEVTPLDEDEHIKEGIEIEER